MKEDNKPVIDISHNKAYTTYADGNNLLFQNFNTGKAGMTETESFVSYEYQRENPRPFFVFEKQKTDAHPQTFVTVVYPFSSKAAPAISVEENAGNDYEEGKIDITVTVDGHQRTLKLNLEK